MKSHIPHCFPPKSQLQYENGQFVCPMCVLVGFKLWFSSSPITLFAAMSVVLFAFTVCTLQCCRFTVAIAWVTAMPWGRCTQCAAEGGSSMLRNILTSANYVNRREAQTSNEYHYRMDLLLVGDEISRNSNIWLGMLREDCYPEVNSTAHVSMS